MLAALDDIMDDVPNAPVFLGELVGQMINAGMIPLMFVKEPLTPVVEAGQAATVLVHTLSTMSEKNVRSFLSVLNLFLVRLQSVDLLQDEGNLKKHIAQAKLDFTSYVPEAKRDDDAAVRALFKDVRTTIAAGFEEDLH